MDQNKKRKYYKVIPRNLIIIFNNELTKVVLLKGSPTKEHWANTYNAIGGHIEKNENILQSAIREVSEETGISLDDNSISLAGLFHVLDYNDNSVIMFLFKAVIEEELLSSSSEGVVKWIEISEISENKSFAPDIKNLIKECLSKKTGDIMFGVSKFHSDKSLEHFDYCLNGELGE